MAKKGVKSRTQPGSQYQFLRPNLRFWANKEPMVITSGTGDIQASVTERPVLRQWQMAERAERANRRDYARNAAAHS
jgi:hypothetical protein